MAFDYFGNKKSAVPAIKPLQGRAFARRAAGIAPRPEQTRHHLAGHERLHRLCSDSFTAASTSWRQRAAASHAVERDP